MALREGLSCLSLKRQMRILSVVLCSAPMLLSAQTTPERPPPLTPAVLEAAARRQAAAALLLEQERQLQALAEQQRADTLRQRDDLGRLLDAVRAEAASAATVGAA